MKPKKKTEPKPLPKRTDSERETEKYLLDKLSAEKIATPGIKLTVKYGIGSCIVCGKHPATYKYPIGDMCDECYEPHKTHVNMLKLLLASTVAIALIVLTVWLFTQDKAPDQARHRTAKKIVMLNTSR